MSKDYMIIIATDRKHLMFIKAESKADAIAKVFTGYSKSKAFRDEFEKDYYFRIYISEE